VQLEAGDWIVVSSDGIQEATDENGEEFGDLRLLTMLDHSDTTDNFCRAALGAVTSFARKQTSGRPDHRGGKNCLRRRPRIAELGWPIQQRHYAVTPGKDMRFGGSNVAPAQRWSASTISVEFKRL
jgi:hypothetical protein